MQGKSSFQIILSMGILFCLVVFMISCRSSTPMEMREKRQYLVIGVSLLDDENPFFLAMSQAMHMKAANLGHSVEIVYCNYDMNRQHSQILRFLQQNVDAVVLSPADSTEAAAIIQMIYQTGTPVFTVDVAAYGVPVEGHIASDNVQGGRLIAQHLASLLEKRGEVAIIHHLNVASVAERVAGFEQVIQQYNDMLIVGKRDGGGKRDSAYAATASLLAEHPQISGIFAANDESALGALAAIEDAGLDSRIVLVGYDGIPEAAEAIRRGSALKASTIQCPEEMGTLSIEIVDAFCAGRPTAPVVFAPCAVMDKPLLDMEIELIR